MNQFAGILSQKQAKPACHVDIFLLPGFCLLELSSILACCASLSTQPNTPDVKPRLLSKTAGKVASDTPEVSAQCLGLDRSEAGSILMILGGAGTKERAADLSHVFAHGKLRGSYIVVLSDAVPTLVKRGVFQSERACVPWDAEVNHDPILEEQVQSASLYSLSKTHATAAGRASTIDILLTLFARRLGSKVVLGASERLLHGPLRSERAGQRISVRDRYFVSNSRLVALIERIESDFSTRVDVQSIADQFGVSARQIQRDCRAELGKTPTALQRDVRMRHGRWYVEMTAKPMLEIALDCGFNSYGAFARQFAACYGISPRTARKTASRTFGQ